METLPQNVRTAAGFTLDEITLEEKTISTYFAGHRTTEDTALRLILRGLCLHHLFSNDRDWLSDVREQFGFVPDSGTYGVNEHREPQATAAFNARLRPLKLHHLGTNGTLLDSHTFSLLEGTWIHPNGMIAGHVDSGRHAVAEDIVLELARIAEAFPELHFVTWNFAPEGGIPMMCVVQNGTVHVSAGDEDVLNAYLDVSGYQDASVVSKDLAREVKDVDPEDWRPIVDRFHADLGLLKRSARGDYRLMDGADLRRALALFPA